MFLPACQETLSYLTNPETVDPSGNCFLPPRESAPPDTQFCIYRGRRLRLS